MTKQNDIFDFGSIIENGVFILGLVLMFSKTVDLLSAFAPSKFLGYEGNEAIYGFAVGLMVEGVVIAVKLTLGNSRNPRAWLWNVITMLVPFVISGFAQVFDSMVVRDTIGQQPAEIQYLITWGVPSIPTIIVALLIIKRIVETRPDSLPTTEHVKVITPAVVKKNGNDKKEAEKLLANPTNGRQN